LALACVLAGALGRGTLGIVVVRLAGRVMASARGVVGPSSPSTSLLAVHAVEMVDDQRCMMDRRAVSRRDFRPKRWNGYQPGPPLGSLDIRAICDRVFVGPVVTSHAYLVSALNDPACIPGPQQCTSCMHPSDIGNDRQHCLIRARHTVGFPLRQSHVINGLIAVGNPETPPSRRRSRRITGC